MSEHPLENNPAERAYIERCRRPKPSNPREAINPKAITGYRRAVLATTGSLPTWLQRRKPGPGRRLNAATEAL